MRGSRGTRGKQGSAQMTYGSTRRGKDRVPPSECTGKAEAQAPSLSESIRSPGVAKNSKEHVRNSERENGQHSTAYNQKSNLNSPLTVNSRKMDSRRSKQQTRSSKNLVTQRPYSMIIPDTSESKNDPRRTKKTTSGMRYTKEFSPSGATISWSCQVNTPNHLSPPSTSKKDDRTLVHQASMIPLPHVQAKVAQVKVRNDCPQGIQNNTSSITNLSDSQNARRSSGLPLDGEVYRRLAMSVDNYIGNDKKYCTGEWKASSDLPYRIKVSESRPKEMLILKSLTRTYDNSTIDKTSTSIRNERSLRAVHQKAATLPKRQISATTPGYYFMGCEGEGALEDVIAGEASLRSDRRRTPSDMDDNREMKHRGASLLYLPAGHAKNCFPADSTLEYLPAYERNYQLTRDKHSDFYKSTPDMRPLDLVVPKPINIPHPPAQNSQHQLQDYANRYGAHNGSVIDGLLEEENEDDTESDLCEQSPPPPHPVQMRGIPPFSSSRPYICTSPQFNTPNDIQGRLSRRGEVMFRSQIYGPHEWDEVIVPKNSWSPVNQERDGHSPSYCIPSIRPAVRMTGSLGRRQGMILHPNQFGKLSPRGVSTDDIFMQPLPEGTKTETHEMTWNSCPQSKNGFQQRTIAVGYCQPLTERGVQAEIVVNRPMGNNRMLQRFSRHSSYCPSSTLLEAPLLLQQPLSPTPVRPMVYGHGDEGYPVSPIAMSHYSVERPQCNFPAVLHNSEIRLHRSPSSSTSLSTRSPKSTVQYTFKPRPQKASSANTFPTKTRSEIELRNMDCLSDPVDLHPDSYIRGRPNFRSGFGGNYSRPNAGIQKLENKYTRSVSLERPKTQSPNQAGVLKRPLVDDHSSTACGNEPEQMTNHKISSCSMHQRCTTNERLSPTVSSACGRQSTHSPSPVLVWTKKTDRERRLNDKLVQLVAQLTTEKQNAVGIVLMTMGMPSCSEQNGNSEGLLSRLVEALQLPQPQLNANGKYLCAECTYGARTCNSLRARPNKLSNKVETISDSNSIGDTRMTQSCYQPLESRDSAVDLPSLEGISTSTLNGHPRESLTTASSTSIDSNSDVEPPISYSSTAGGMATPDNGPCYTSTVRTVLRRLARCLAVRISLKRQHLAEAQKNVARNANEEKWLRNKLNELFTMNGTTAATSPSVCSRCDSSFSATEPFDTPTAQVVTRFDRWHNNITSVLQLLCQLARRLAWTDAQILSLSRREVESNHPFRSIEAINRTSRIQPTMEILNNQKATLQAKIKEAQELRAGLETCRVRLLENIPPGLKVEDPSIVELPLDKSSTSPVADITNGTLPHSFTDTLQSQQSVTLRERIAVHLNNTLRWLITSQILETEIRVEQELYDAMQGELRYEMN